MLGLAVSLCAETPDAFLRYVEATGQQAVDIGVRGRYGMKMDARLLWTDVSGDTGFLDARADGNTESRVFFAHCSGGNHIGMGYGEYGWTTYKDGTNNRHLYWEPDRIYHVVTEFAVATNVTETQSVVTNLVEDPETPGVTNEVEETVTTVTTNLICRPGLTVDGQEANWKQNVYDLFDTGQNLYLFASNIGGTAQYKAKARCYALKLWQDDENGNRQLVRDLKPCLKNGRAGLYDTVSDTIFYSNTGTDLVYDENYNTPDIFLESVISFGDTYIDTEVIGRSGVRAEADFEWLEIANNGSDLCLLGARATWGGSDRIMPIHNWGGVLVGYGEYYRNQNFKYSAGTRYRVESDLRAGSQTVIVNGETVYSGANAATIDTGRNLYLFANNRGGTVNTPSRIRLYSLKIWQTDANTGVESLVRNFRPCAKNGEIALYDEESRTIFYPQENPLKGEAAPEPAEKGFYFVEYIQANGRSHLDTGVRARSGTRVAGEMTWTLMRNSKEERDYLANTENGGTERTYLGATKGGNASSRFYPMHENDKTFWSGYGNQAIYPSTYTTNQTEVTETDPDTGAVTTRIVETVTTNRIGLAANVKYAFDISYAAGLQTVDLNGSRIMETNSAATVDTENNLYLFGCNRGDLQPVRYKSHARCHGLDIWQDGVRVRNFKPCVKDGWAMLYDTETRALYSPVPPIPAAGNIGEILPLTGDEKPAFYLEYVDSDKTQFIDTGVTGRSGTTAEFEMQWLAGSDDTFLGSRANSGDTRYFMWHWARNSISYGYGGFRYPKNGDPTETVANTSTEKVPAQLGVTYHVRTSLGSGAQVIAVNGETIVNRTEALDLNTERPLYIFACNNAGTPAYSSKARLYWLKIWQDGYLVRDFRPVQLDNTLPALWDARHNEIYSPNKPFSDVGPVGNKVIIHYGTVLFIK